MEQVAVGRVQLDEVEPGPDGPVGGGGERGEDALDAIAIQGERLRALRTEGDGAGADDWPTTLGEPPPRQGTSVLALRPAWASWMPAAFPCVWMKRTSRFRGSMCRSLQIPRSPGVIRPAGVMAVASTTMRPTPPAAREPRWTRCQSSAMPSFATYWHIGDITIRFGSVSPRRRNGVNRSASGVLRSC
jgi:hypothetical protein